MPSIHSGIRRVLVVLLAVQTCWALAEVIPVAPSYQGFLASSEPTMTFLFPTTDARATLVFIPGGEGRVGLKPEWTAEHRYFSRYHFNLALRSLGDSKQTSGRYNVVIFDSPVDLLIANHWSPMRMGSEHLSRVEDVVRHYRNKLGKPVWLMGHSMGSISVTEFYKRLQDNKSEDLITGLIISGGENGTSLNYTATRLPVLVLHHENDECVGNTPAHARKLHEKLAESGNAAAELAFIKTGTRSPDNNNPCRSGYHMYYGAGDDLARVLDQFMGKHLDRP
jgi:hypothetical protein